MVLCGLLAFGERAAMYAAASKDAEIRAATSPSMRPAARQRRSLARPDHPPARGTGLELGSIGAEPANHAELRRLTSRYAFVEALWLTDQDGWPRVTSRQFPAPRIDTSDREYFIILRDRRSGPQVSRLIASRATQGSNIVFARRLEDGGGTFKGIA